VRDVDQRCLRQSHDAGAGRKPSGTVELFAQGGQCGFQNLSLAGEVQDAMMHGEASRQAKLGCVAIGRERVPGSQRQRLAAREHRGGVNQRPPNALATKVRHDVNRQRKRRRVANRRPPDRRRANQLRIRGQRNQRLRRVLRRERLG
jgi:hypothetical protein